MYDIFTIEFIMFAMAFLLNNAPLRWTSVHQSSHIAMAFLLTNAPLRWSSVHQSSQPAKQWEQFN